MERWYCLKMPLKLVEVKISTRCLRLFFTEFNSLIFGFVLSVVNRVAIIHLGIIFLANTCTSLVSTRVQVVRFLMQSWCYHPFAGILIAIYSDNKIECFIKNEGVSRTTVQFSIENIFFQHICFQKGKLGREIIKKNILPFQQLSMSSNIIIVKLDIKAVR